MRRFFPLLLSFQPFCQSAPDHTLLQNAMPRKQIHRYLSWRQSARESERFTPSSSLSLTSSPLSLLSLSGLWLCSCDSRLPQCLICPGRFLTSPPSGRTVPPPPPPHCSCLECLQLFIYLKPDLVTCFQRDCYLCND